MLLEQILVILVGLCGPVEGAKLQRIMATECKRSNIQAEISEAALHEPFRMRESNMDLLQMHQKIVYMF